MQHLITLIPQLAGKRILVVGDVILDEYLIGNTTRMSREAPVPVLEFRERRHLPGGAANPAATVVSLGSAALQVGVTGTDNAAAQLTHVLKQRGILAESLIADDSRPTTVKMRVMAHMGLRFPQQVARMDTLSRDPINPDVARQIVNQIEVNIEDAAAILFSDYRAGMLTPNLVRDIRDIALDRGCIVTADAQGNFEKYTGCTLVKCNAAEASTALRRVLHTDADFAAAAQELCQRLSLTGGMVITRGADGATLVTPSGETQHCDAPAVTDVFDTVGAGDTAVAVITLALCAGIPLPDAVALANYASGLVVRKVGNYAPTPQELAWALETWG